jgi:hypothetical protein
LQRQQRAAPDRSQFRYRTTLQSVTAGWAVPNFWPYFLLVTCCSQEVFSSVFGAVPYRSWIHPGPGGGLRRKAIVAAALSMVACWIHDKSFTSPCFSTLYRDDFDRTTLRRKPIATPPFAVTGNFGRCASSTYVVNKACPPSTSKIAAASAKPSGHAKASLNDHHRASFE